MFDSDTDLMDHFGSSPLRAVSVILFFPIYYPAIQSHIFGVLAGVEENELSMSSMILGADPGTISIYVVWARRSI